MQGNWPKGRAKEISFNLQKPNTLTSLGTLYVDGFTLTPTFKDDVYEYNEFDTNLYLFFSRAYTNDQCLYNLEKNKCEEYDYKGIKDYSNGYYYYDDEKIYITDSHSDEIK